MRIWRISILMAGLFAFALSSSADARHPPWIESGPSQGQNLRISLLTFGPGDEIASWFGHTALVVEDTFFGEARVYNYGMFHFGPDMLPSYVRGRLWFWVADASLPGTISMYKRMNRDVRIQVLNLPPDRRRRMAAFLAWNVLPDNRDYLYDHYLDNCATRIRDAIDDAVDGQFRVFASRPSRTTFRGHTHRHTRVNLYIDILLSFWMNSQIDTPIELWDDMFLPGELEALLNEFHWTDEDGVSHPIVESHQVIYEAHGRYQIPHMPPRTWPLALLIGALLGGFAVLCTILRRRGKFRRLARVVQGFYMMLIGIFIGIPGLGILLYLGTDHTITHYNRNILLSSPLTFLALPLGVALIFGWQRADAWLKRIFELMFVTSVLAVLLQLLPWFTQDSHLVISLLLPANLGMALAFRSKASNEGIRAES